ncbi:hypothetical protein TWF696_006688 [Orbilia brochopaga]|uniref:Sodium/calcium exchanger membrane region domain-containing protein n=1 Tax=Orbilia brochopaga TaxID=3140254 RepID=A0AAV9UVV0_9PEZI
MHKVKSWARSKAHAHGFNPWSADPDQQATGTVETPNPTTNGTPAAPASSNPGALDSNSLRTAAPAPERRRTSLETRRDNAARRRRAPSPPGFPTIPTVDTVHTERTVHFTTDDSPNNTGNHGEPPDNPGQAEKPGVLKRFYKTFVQILFHSWINVLLVFVPLGIAVDLAHLHPTIIFSVNCIALVPLAGLLSYATESVAHRLGDTIGALMNVTFGNAVELIIFM